jgi:hypothetical protein
MNKPDLLITWIKHCDYPIFRYWLEKYRNKFGKVIIYWSEHFRDMYYDAFIQNSLINKKVDCIYIPHKEYIYGVEDWRNISTNRMLEHSSSEWVCSIEQDFFAKDWDLLFKKVESLMFTNDLIGYRGHQGQEYHQSYLTNDYVHPSFWFMNRKSLERTNKNFSADPDQGADHFGLITRDAQKLGLSIAYIQNYGMEEFKDVFHLGGVNMNYLEFKPEFKFHRPEIFCVYNYWSMKVPVAQSQQFYSLCQKIDGVFKLSDPYIDPEKSEWKKFFEIW